jgi:AcrR family transcriptional regulator
MARSSAAEAQRTREAIVARATDMASVAGLEGVTIGRLASDLGMSKAGVIGQFGSKGELQMAALDAASQAFVAAVWAPAADRAPGLPRLLAICDAWVDYVARPPYQGGCFFTAVSTEFDTRGGPVHEAVQGRGRQWRKVLRREVTIAIEAGDLSADLDPDQAVFELESIPMGLNQSLQLYDDRRATARARRAMRRVLGVEGAATAAR